MTPPPAPEPGRDTTAAERRASRLGLVLLAVYVVIYGGFAVAAAWHPGLLARRPLGGLNLAVWWGFGLIVAPLALAAVYLWLLRSRP